VAEAAIILPVTPVEHPQNSVVIGGLHSDLPHWVNIKRFLPGAPLGD
jgi:hypothetical protein